MAPGGCSIRETVAGFHGSAPARGGVLVSAADADPDAVPDPGRADTNDHRIAIADRG